MSKGTRKAAIAVCVDPAVLAGSIEKWERLLRTPEYAHLCAWNKQMCRLRDYVPTMPTYCLPTPSRGPDVTEWRGTPPVWYGGIRIRKGDTLWDLFGVLWNYVYGLKVNKDFRGKFHDPNKIKAGELIYFPISFQYGDETLWPGPGQRVDVPLPPVSPKRSGTSRAPRVAGTPPNNLGCKTAGVLQGKLEWPTVKFANCGTAVSGTNSTIDYSIQVSPGLKDKARYTIGGAWKKMSVESSVNATTKELNLVVDGNEFKIDGAGNLELKGSKGVFKHIGFSSKEGLKRDLAGGSIIWESPLGKVKLDSSVSISDTKLEYKVSGKHWTIIEAKNKNKITVTITHSLTLWVDFAQMAKAVLCKPVPIPFRLPKPLQPKPVVWYTAVGGFVLVVVKATRKMVAGAGAKILAGAQQAAGMAFSMFPILAHPSFIEAGMEMRPGSGPGRYEIR